MSEAVRPPELAFTGERYVPTIDGNIKLEHLHRYAVAREWCRGKQVLDVACGEGYGSDLLAEVASSVVGVDLAFDAVRHATRRYGGARRSFVAGQCAAIPLRDQSIDVVVSFETIEHHDRHDEMMREIRRVLRPDGLLIISSPDRREYSEVPGYTNPFHVRELSREEFEALLRAHFPHVALAGQRVKAGSLIWPLEDSTAGLVGFPADGRGSPASVPPMYLIAVAGDRLVSAPASSLLDGGSFTWSAEHEEALRVANQYVAYAAELTEAKNAAEHENVALRREVDTTRAEMETTRASAAALQDQIQDVTARMNHLAACIATLESERGILRESLETLQVERRLLEGGRRQLDAERQKLEERLRIMEHSHSWRLTAPLRALRRVLGSGRPSQDHSAH